MEMEKTLKKSLSSNNLSGLIRDDSLNVILIDFVKKNNFFPH